MRAVSTTFSKVQPTGYFTDEIIPAVLRGKDVGSIKSNPEGRLFVRTNRDTAWESFDPELTVFGDAHRLGWRLGIAGWYNPYCRLFAAEADSCSWLAASDTFRGHMDRRNTVIENALAPLLSKAGGSQENSETAEHRAAYPILVANSLGTASGLEDPICFSASAGTASSRHLLDRTSHAMRNGGSYLDNLALADEVLGELRAAIEATPAARNTTLVVSSDHSMRVAKWRGGLYWTKEDEEVFHDRFDPRPVLMIHFAGNGEDSDREDILGELETHDLVEAICRGR